MQKNYSGRNGPEICTTRRHIERKIGRSGFVEKLALPSNGLQGLSMQENFFRHLGINAMTV